MKKGCLAAMLACVVFASRATVDARQLLGCSISASPVSFGAYSVFDANPDEAEGTVNYQCLLALLIRVELNKGSSTTFDPRTMKDGTKPPINYNLFLDSGHGTIWGDGTNNTGRISHIVIALFSHQARVYGQIPPQQDVTPGSYSDSVTASIIF